MTSWYAHLYGAHILEKHDMKPLWEKLLEYYTMAGMFTGLLLFHTVQPEMEADCLPIEPENMTFLLTKPQSDFADSFCATKFNFNYGYLAACYLLITVTILFLSNVWLSYPSVVNSIRTLSKVKHELEKLYMMPTQVKKALRGKGAEEDKVSAIAELRWVVWRFDGKTNIWRMYMKRCAVLAMLLGGTVAAALYIDTTYFSEKVFNCTLEIPIYPYEKFSCHYNMPVVARPYVLLGCTIVSLQLATVIIGSFYVAISLRLKDRECFTSRFNSVRMMIQFLKVFWINSGLLRCKGFKEFLDEVTSKDYLDQCYNTNNQKFKTFYKEIMIAEFPEVD